MQTLSLSAAVNALHGGGPILSAAANAHPNGANANALPTSNAPCSPHRHNLPPINLQICKFANCRTLTPSPNSETATT